MNQPPNTPYLPEFVPPTGTDASRYVITGLPGGWNAGSVGETVAVNYNVLGEQLVRAAEDAPPVTASVQLRRVAKTEDGYALTPGITFTGPVTVAPERPTKFQRSEFRAGALVDDFLLRGESWHNANDQAVWEALLALCEQITASPPICRRLSQEIARALLLRAGIRIAAFSELPS